MDNKSIYLGSNIEDGIKYMYYEYKNHTYIVNVGENEDCTDSIMYQHKKAKNKIDMLIANGNNDVISGE